MNGVEIGQVNEENGTKRLIGEDVAKRMKESDGLSGEEREKIAVGIDMAGRSQKISVS